MSQSPPPSLTQFQMPNVQKANEGKCQKVVDQDTLEAKYVFGFCSYLDLPLFDTCLHLQKYHNLIVKYLPIDEHHFNILNAKCTKSKSRYDKLKYFGKNLRS